MGDQRVSAALTGGIALLERAISYTLGSLHDVSREDLPRATPCADWNLHALLGHMDDSLAALHEAAAGWVDLESTTGQHGTASDPVGIVRDRARRVLGAWNSTRDEHLVLVADCPITMEVVASAGALEIAVHGWDVARACGRDRPLPPPLAEQMLELSAVLVTDADRPARFATPHDVPSGATVGDRLLAYLGRSPS